MKPAEITIRVTDPVDLKYLLAKEGYGIGDVADELGITPATVSGVIAGSSVSERVEQKIAELLDLELEHVQWVTRRPTAHERFPGNEYVKGSAAG